ncbi:MAG: cobalt ECF transporter T component CbiQ [Syntrophobacterales bacterium]|nr:cobalt ECF transporter T component CbiQ [Syntrophobacterales bacterium]
MSSSVLRIPAYLWLSSTLVVFLFFFIGFIIKKIGRPNSSISSFEVKVPSIGVIREKSFWHRWDPRIRIASSLLFCFFSVSLSKVPLLLVSLGWSVLFSIAVKMPISLVARRLKPVLIFVLVIAILLPLTATIEPSSRIIIFEPFTDWPINYEAFIKAITIAIKAITVVITTTLILEMSPYTVTITALQKIGIPTGLSQMLLLTYRYIFVVIDEAERMARAMTLRGFYPKTNIETFKVIGQFIGTLFLRSFERVQRITEAMELRGYKGQFPDFYHFKSKPGDWILGLLWVGISFGLFIVQHFFL